MIISIIIIVIISNFNKCNRNSIFLFTLVTQLLPVLYILYFAPVSCGMSSIFWYVNLLLREVSLFFPYS